MISRRALLPIAIVSSLASIAAFPSTRENIRFNRISLEHGLSQSSVNCMAQDPRGMMWFGTQDGLNRFDGYDFTIFRPDPSDPASIAHEFIWAVHVDHAGNLWVGTEGGGLDRWNPRDDTFTHHVHDPDDDSSLASDEVRAIAEGPPGVLWIGTVNGLSRLDVASGKFTSYRHHPSKPRSLGSNEIRAVLVDRLEAVWVGTDGAGLDRLDAGADGWVHYRHEPNDPTSISSDAVRSIHEDADGKLWVGTYEAGLNRLDRAVGKFRRFAADPTKAGAIGHDRVRGIFSDASGTLWIGTDDGLNRWDAEEERFEVYRNVPGDPYSLSNDRVLSIFQDRGGLLWVATQAGLNRWNPLLGTFAHFKQDARAPSTLSNNIVTSLASGPDNALWIGTYGGGLNLLDRETARYRQFRHDAADDGSLSDNRVMSLLRDSRGELWVGTLAGGLNRFRPESGGFQRFLKDPQNPTSLGANGVTVIRESSRGGLWVGTYGGGLNLMHVESRTFKRFRHDAADPTSLSNDRIMAIHEDRAGAIWIGTAGGGLNRLDPGTGRTVHFSHDATDPATLSGDSVLALHESGDDTLWIGTQGRGLNRWRPAARLELRNEFDHYTERHGLANATIYGILEDGDGLLWLSTNKGLSRFDPVSGAVTNYDVTHGLQGNEFNHGAYHRSAQGELFFGGTNGFNAFFPERIRHNSYVPPITLTGMFKLNERARLDRPIWEVDLVELDHSDQVVSFEFAAMDFSAPVKNRYAYRLEGFDDGWIELGNMRRATYTNLDPGRYVLRIRGCNNDGVWNEEGASLAILVHPPPWRTWWAYTLYTFFAGGVVLSYLRNQARKLRREEEHSRRLEQTVRERTGELATRNEELAGLNRKLEQASLTDAHTGLRNRRYLMTYIPEVIALIDREYRKKPATMARSHGRDVLFLTLDLDGFKSINDTYGHEAGDRALLHVRDCLVGVFRSSDTLIRLGGDEFLVVARDTDREAATVLAERLRQAVQQIRLDVGGGRAVRIGCSIGFAFYPFKSMRPTAVDWEQIIALADRALYMAKASGRNAWAGILEGPVPASDESIEVIQRDPERAAREGRIVVVSSAAEASRWTATPAGRGEPRG